MEDQNQNKASHIKEAEDKIRDLINWVKIKNLEELEAGEGKKIEDDTAQELMDKLRELAAIVGEAEI